MRLTIPSEVLFEVLEGEAVLLQLKSGKYFSLNRTGTFAWQLIEKFGTLEQVKRAMAEEYRVPAVQISRDLDRLVDLLLENGLLLLENPENSQ